MNAAESGTHQTYTRKIPLALRLVSVVNGAVIKRTLTVLFATVGICVSAFGQFDASGDDVETITREDLEKTGEVETGPALTLERPDLFSSVDSTALIHGLPVLTLLDGRRFPASDLGRMGMTPFDLVPVAFLTAVDVQTVGVAPRFGTDGPGGVVNLRTRTFDYGGEVGFMYGRSTGKYGREDYSTYIIGGVGNDKFNITAGAYYHESTWRAPRRR